MKKYSLTKNDFILHLWEQLYFLDSSLTNFSKYKIVNSLDNKALGLPFDFNLPTEIEAKRIATSIRVLIHDKNKSESLLKHLNIKSKIRFVDSAAPNDGRLHSMTGMTGVRGSKNDGYFGLVAKINNQGQLNSVPLFIQHLKEWYQSYQKIDFNTWWDNLIIEVAGQSFSRKDIVLMIADKDGGAHVDKIVSEEYITTKNSSIELNILGTKIALERNVVFATVAQIGWELLNSIDNSIDKQLIN